VIATFTFDADGKRVKSVIDQETILFVGAHFEIKNGNQITKYYMAGSTRIAMRKYTIPQNMTVEYLLSDHLGSTSLTADADGNKVLEIRYKAWGEVRATWTNVPVDIDPAYKMPLYQYTGQASYMDDPLTSGVTEGFGLMFYNARWYDPYLSRFVQADSIIPEQSQGTQAWDRYAYVSNCPVKYNDLSGHCPICITAAIGAGIGLAVNLTTQLLSNGGNLKEVNVGELLVATAVGAASGAVGFGIAGLAMSVGATVTNATGSAVVGLAADLVIGGSLSGASNVVFSSVQRIGTDLVRGNEVTANSVVDDLAENAGREMGFGAAGYGFGRGLAEVYGGLYQGGKSGATIRSSLHDPFHPLQTQPLQPLKLFDPRPAQKAMIGVLHAFADAVSNPTLYDCVTRSCRSQGN
jgi:RHS repeat-associated protein